MEHSPKDVRKEIAIVGRACRLPGAHSVSDLWRLLEAGRCSVSAIPPDRWPQRYFGHPKPRQRGKSYTWAAGVLDDIWGFDPAVFRISPREAEQIDPQQRLMLELAFEACEDAGFAPSDLAGSAAGVYVGASALDYSTIALHDPALADSHFATGNTLSIVSNRVSYAFDLHGPSMTIDTACSSSLVALHQAVQALAREEIETAVVGGVNILAGPFGFIGFSQAMMLSPTGLCHAFSADADGYVRSEGGVVFVLKTLDRAVAEGDRIHAVISGTGVNTDGRTTGISLPSEAAQRSLLRSVYERAGVAPDAIAYVEAHGTGTEVGDPVEAEALGAALGSRRSRPLPIGSIKTNIGHLEPASGFAGMLKAMLALEHDTAPPSLHCDRLNPYIDFKGLNLSVTQQATALPRTRGRRYAGVSSFGFGGSNAHVILSDPPHRTATVAPEPRWLMLSAQNEEALRVLADGYAARIASCGEGETRRVVAATGYRRERMAQRLILPASEPETLRANLRAFAESGGVPPSAARGTEVEGDRSVVFVFSGNGSQWDGMGRAAVASSLAFRSAIGEVDAHFRRLAGWSLVEALASPSLGRDLARTSVAQPLIFAIQVASVRALAEDGVRPDLVIGHSVGEVAAAEASGALSLADAVEVIYHRSRHQEAAANKGGMAVVVGPREAALGLIGELPELTVAAHNSWRCVVAAGPDAALERLAKRARAGRGAKVQRLDLAYPFHTPHMEPARRPLLDSLAHLAPREAEVAFSSSVGGHTVGGAILDARYWWRNVREPVHFQETVERALATGKRIFLEIGPRPVLRGHIHDAISRADLSAVIDSALDDRAGPSDGDPFERVAMRLLAVGGAIDSFAAFGADPGPGLDLPAYPWRHKTYRFGETAGATGAFSQRRRHPYAGARVSPDALEWRADLDLDLAPELADHRIQGQTPMPGAAFVEMALAVAREWKGSDAVAIADFEILRPLVFAPNASREILCRVSAPTATIEIMSRPRLSVSPFALHARGQIFDHRSALHVETHESPALEAVDGETLYAKACAAGLDFGPGYRQLAATGRNGDVIDVMLTPAADDPRFGLDPARLDSCFHGLILVFDQLGAETVAYLPVRFGEIRLAAPGASISGARIRIRRADATAIVADFDLFAATGEVAATLREARYQPARARPQAGLADFGLTRIWVPATADLIGTPIVPLPDRAPSTSPSAAEPELSEAAALVEGWASAAALRLARALAVDGVVDLDALVLSGRFPNDRRRWAAAAFDSLAAAGLIVGDSSTWRLTCEDLPAPRAVLETLAARHPERSAELLAAAHVGGRLEDFACGAAALEGPSERLLEMLALHSTQAAAATLALRERLEELSNASRNRGALRMLLIGAGAAMSAVVEFAERRSARLTIVDFDARRLERARHRFASVPEVAFASGLDSLPERGFDCLVSAGGLSDLGLSPGALERLAVLSAPGASLVAVEPAPSRFRDFVSGLSDDHAPPARPADVWRSRLLRARFSTVHAELVKTGDDLAIAVAARIQAAPARRGTNDVLILRDDHSGFSVALADALARREARCRIADRNKGGTFDRRGADGFVWIPGPAHGDAAFRVAAECLALRNALSRAGSKPFFVALDRSDPAFASAVASFLRVFANEAPSLDIRRVEIETLSPALAPKFAAVITSGTDEADITLMDQGVAMLRYAALKAPIDAASQGGDARRLEKSLDGGLDRLIWKPVARRAPGPGEVEVEIGATGLNFRDAMWVLSVLPDEMLEGGFAGPTLGLEFAGTVVGVGLGVESVCRGDRVLGFAGGAFCTHLTVAVADVAPIPSGLSFEAAATIPVAFLTAWHALVGCADLKAGEWALIHGGAGGVGLAALQIARLRGARAIATAGSPEKRDLARALGAEYAFDSRSDSFVEEVMRVTAGRGVGVVLNSLAGEMMERSIGLLESFGRFVELGKRDYLANTAIGLRPFRRNLSYFGVDLDQMLSERPDLARRLFADVLRGFERGDFDPLPLTVFEATEVAEAMRLMQQSGHVGKIVVRAPHPEPESAALQRRPFVADAKRAHLITGGLGGFGIETARWLVSRGARRLVLVGRSGLSSEAARLAVEAMCAKAVEVRVEALDIADAQAAEDLFARLKVDGWPLAGVVHAAMTLEDGILANLDEATLLRVLRPKVAGAANLDRLTRDLPLDYFVLFSSATTVIGNPGQGAYVAANGWLEGLARERVRHGLPTLAVGWGAIADVGVLARSSATREAIAARAGVRGMEAKAALDLMGEALAYEGGPAGDGVVIIADVNWVAAKANLPILRERAYGRLTGGAGSDDAETRSVDLRALVERLPPEEVRRAVADLVTEELSRVLRLPREEIGRTKPLSELGLDSLMAVELALALESRLSLDAPLGEAASAFNVMELAQRILSSVVGEATGPMVSDSLAARHLEETERAQVVERINRIEAASSRTDAVE